MNIFEQIKEKVDCFDVAELCGIQVRGGRCKSFRSDAKSSTSVQLNSASYYDHAGDDETKFGDCIKMYQMYKGYRSAGEAAYALAREIGIQQENYSLGQYKDLSIINTRAIRLVRAAVNFFHENLKEEDRAYLMNERGLSEDLINELKLGSFENPNEHLIEKGFTQAEIAESSILKFSNRIILPYWRNGKVASITGRTTSKTEKVKYRKLKNNEHIDTPIWGIDEIRRNRTERVLVVEGNFDAMACKMVGEIAIATSSLRISSKQWTEIESELKDREVLICFDSDPEGVKGAKALCEEFYWRGIKANVLNWGEIQTKVDLSHIYAETKDLAILRDDSKSISADEIMISKLRDPNSVQTFLRRVMKTYCMVENEITRDLVEESKILKPKILKKIIKSIEKKPTEADIHRGVLDQIGLCFRPSTGWLEFKKSHWADTHEHNVRKLVWDEYGDAFASNSIVVATENSLKTATICESEEQFDSHEYLLNLKNGVLNLKTGEMLDHSKDFWLTKVIERDYIKNAKRIRWEKFIDSVTMGNKKRAEALQDAAGYSLMRTAKYHKCYMLIGEGSNGKSMFLETIAKVLGSKNISSMMLNQIGDRFATIKLRGALANIGEETKVDSKGIEAHLKTVTAGGRVTGEYKGKDIVEFSPTCTMFFSMNKMIKVAEVNEGFKRRLEFLDFKMHYVDESEYNPENPTQAIKDYSMADSLELELDGILAWMVEGAQRIIKRDKLTESPDTKERINEMIQGSSPIQAFMFKHVSENIEEFGKIGCVKLYETFKMWAELSGYDKRIIPNRVEFGDVIESNKIFGDVKITRSIKSNIYEIKEIVEDAPE